MGFRLRASTGFGRFRKFALMLVCLSGCLQLSALSGLVLVRTPTQKAIYGSMEMLLVVLLLINGWAIWRAIKYHHVNQGGTPVWVVGIARLCFLSLALCVMGDLVNRNFPGIYYQYGSNVKHTYLADSVWFFFPGYCCFISATYLAGRRKNLSLRLMGLTAFLCVVAGLVSFAGMYKEGAGTYVATMTGTYAALIPVMCASALWLLKSYGWQAMKWVASGAVLATIADALIGNFWIYREGYFPAISYLNWIIYFASQALIQQLPIKLLQQAT
jgi:hypothetical protein